MPGIKFEEDLEFQIDKCPKGYTHCIEGVNKMKLSLIELASCLGILFLSIRARTTICCGCFDGVAAVMVLSVRVRGDQSARTQ